MRTIKFRAWDKKDKELVKGVFNMLIRVGEPLENERFEFMQFTGLKDKNGKEIFEGDILLNEGDIDEHTDKYWVVKFLSGSFQMQTVNQIGIVTYKNIALQNNITVVGNVFEHPNLLK